MNVYLIRSRALIGVSLIALGIPYLAMTWWKYASATVIILFCFRLAYPLQWKKVLGLEISRQAWIRGLGLIVMLSLISEGVIRAICLGSGVIRVPEPFLSTWIFQPTFQALNEEMIARAFAFFVLGKWIRNQTVLVWVLAALFMALHYVFILSYEHIVLSWVVLASLLFASVAMNRIFLRSGTIIYTFAIHMAWNYRKFGPQYFFESTGLPLKDGHKFNLVEGSYGVLLVCVILCVWSHRQKSVINRSNT